MERKALVRSVNPDVIEIKQFLKSIMIDISNISNTVVLTCGILMSSPNFFKLK